MPFLTSSNTIANNASAPSATAISTTNSITVINNKRQIEDKIKQAKLDQQTGIVQSINEKKIESINDDCEICLETLLAQPISEITCGHVYHTECVKKYVSISNKKNMCAKRCNNSSNKITNYNSAIELVDSNIKYTDESKNKAMGTIEILPELTSEILTEEMIVERSLEFIDSLPLDQRRAMYRIILRVMYDYIAAYIKRF